MQTVRLKVMDEGGTEVPINVNLEHGNVRLRHWPTSPRMRSTDIYRKRPVNTSSAFAGHE
jgi:hypothetical protein